MPGYVPFASALALALALAPVPPLAAAEPLALRAGPHAVRTADDLALRDAARQSDLPCRAYHPADGGPYPVVVFSHGFGANHGAFAGVGKHWASHGYVVIHPSHADGVGKARREPAREEGAGPAARPRGGGFAGGLNDPRKAGGRVADVTLVLDSLDDLPKIVPALKGKIDKERVGVAGHSFGAYTAMLVGGVTADLGGERGKSYLDKRVKCILPISGQGAGQQGLTERSWDGLKLPMMTITGTRDRGAGGQGLAWKRGPYDRSPAGDKYLVVVDGASHVSFGGGLGPRGDDVVACVGLASTRFWDAYLKDSAPAKEYLRAGRLLEDTGGKCAFERK